MIAIVVVYDQQMAYFAVIPLLILKDYYKYFNKPL